MSRSPWWIVRLGAGAGAVVVGFGVVVLGLGVVVDDFGVVVLGAGVVVRGADVEVVGRWVVAGDVVEGCVVVGCWVVGRAVVDGAALVLRVVLGAAVVDRVVVRGVDGAALVVRGGVVLVGAVVGTHWLVLGSTARRCGTRAERVARAPSPAAVAVTTTVRVVREVLPVGRGAASEVVVPTGPAVGGVASRSPPSGAVRAAAVPTSTTATTAPAAPAVLAHRRHAPAGWAERWLVAGV